MRRAGTESLFASVDEREQYVQRSRELVEWYRGGYSLTDAPKWLGAWPPNSMFAGRLLGALVEALDDAMNEWGQ